MKIAVAQINTTLGDFAGTVAKMVEQTRVAAERGCDLTVFPMPVLTGYDLGSLADSPQFMQGVASALESFSRQARTPSLVPFYTALGGTPATEVGYFRDGEMVPLRMAAFIQSMMSQGLLLGEEPKASFALGDMDVAVCTNYDSLTAYAEGSLDADVIIYLPFSPFETDDESTALAPSLTDGAYVRLATDANSWIVAAGAVGAWDDVVYPGGSFVLTPWGELACAAPSFEESLLVADVNLLLEGPLAEHVELGSYNRKRFVWDALTLSLHDFVVKGGYEGVALCLMGDVLTSALAVLATDALGPTNVRGFIPPFLGEEALACARDLAATLKISLEDEGGMDASQLNLVFERGVPRGSGSAARPGARESANFLARDPKLLAGAWLLAERAGGKVVPLTAVDKTALACGQDVDGFGCASYAPFKDVYRSDIVAILPERNLVSPVVPAPALQRLLVPEGLGLEELAPTAERQLSVVDAALLTHVEHDQDLVGMVDHGIEEEFAKRLLERLDASELARRTCPMGPVISDCALSERERPLPCAWHDVTLEPEEGEAGAEANAGEVPPAGPTGGLSITLPPSMLQRLPGDVLRYLKDFAQGGGMDGSSDDIWGQGLFSKN